MSVTLIGKDNFPTYIALSTDITSGSIVNTPLIGKTVYTTDDQAWYIITGTSGSSYKTASFVMPALET
jgi:hypothetical protein